MSGTDAPALVLDWIKRGLKWKYVWSPKQSANLTIPAGGHVDIPYADRIYKHPEGVLINTAAVFDSPLCGVGAYFDPEYDSGEFHSSANFLIVGFTNMPSDGYVMVPPKISTGLYAVGTLRTYNFLNYIKFTLFNKDVLPHRCLTYAFTLAVLEMDKIDRKKDFLFDAEIYKKE